MHFWCWVIASKYGVKGMGHVEGHMVVVFGKVSEQAKTVSLSMSFEVRDGTHVRFRHNQCSGHHTLKDLYPDLYAYSVDKDALVT